MKNRIGVLVTTKLKGVFFGYLTEEVHGIPEYIELENARNCLAWDSSRKGVFGLASIGPSSSCRVGPSVDSIKINEITAIAECSEEAIAAWERGPWNN